MRITSVDRRAADAGLSAGMTLARARAQCPEMRVEAADDNADARALTGLAEACEMFTPLVALSPPDGLVLDITGCAHLFGGEATLRVRLCRRLARIGFSARAAIAGTPDAARMLARFAAVEVVPPGQEAEAVAALPVTALECDLETGVALIRAGLKTLGDLATRPSRVLAARFGTDLTTRLARVMGHEDIRITPLRAPPDLIAERHFPEPITVLEGCLAVLADMAASTGEQMERRGEGGRIFEATLFGADGTVRRLALETSRPTRDAATLMRLFRLRLETLAEPLDPGFGFDALRLSILGAEPMVARQIRLDGERDHDDTFAELVDRLITRLGRENVLRFVAGDSHDPTRAATVSPVASRHETGTWPQPKQEEPPSRPLTLFDPPQPIDEAIAEVPDAPPRLFRWRRVLHEVVAAEGPERIAPEWWRDRARASTRDYYRIEDAEGRRFWLFREGFYGQDGQPPRWFLHGLFA